MALLSVTTLLACKKDKTSTATVNNQTIMGTVLKQGSFTSANGYTVTGSAKVIDSSNVKTLRLENFSTSNGPALKVYLATSASATTFIDLGNLISTNGNHNYTISGSPDLNNYRYALIWCVAAGRLFGSAVLQ
jgi:hypothetical protein